MRNPNRIPKYIAKLEKYWSKVPDWRFGQLINNMRQVYKDKNKSDGFYTEDEQFFEFFDDFFNVRSDNSEETSTASV